MNTVGSAGRHVLVAAVIGLLAVTSIGLTAVPSAAAATSPTYVAQREWNVTGGNGMAVSPRTGDVFVTGSSANVVRRYSRAGKLLKSWSVQGPLGVDVDGDGNVLVASYAGIIRYSPTGKVLQTFADESMMSAADLAVAGNGDVLAVDYVSDVVKVFRANGTLRTEWGESGSGPGQLDEPSALDIGPDGLVYVADTRNNRIQVFTAAGAPVRRWGQQGSARGRLWHPQGVAVTKDGHVLVGDPGEFPVSNRRVQVFSATGKLLDVLGGPKKKVFGATKPWQVDVDAAGRLFVVDTNNSGNPTVKSFRPAARPGIVGKKLVRRAKVVTLKVKCPKGTATCQGTVLVKHRSAKVAKGTFALKAGKKKTIRARITPKGKKVLRKKKPNRLVAVLNPGQGVKNVKKKLRVR